jgi:hypothetical protein
MNYLYVKTHNITGLKYLGKTTKDPFKYQGSGKYWKRHIKKYGYDVVTEILYQSENIEDIRKIGMYYSNVWNIVESEDWANLIEEYGTGGDTSSIIDYVERDKRNLEKYGVSCVFKSQEVIDKMKSTRVKRYGVEWASQSSEIQNIIKVNSLQKYGVDSANKLDRRKDEVKDHNLYLSNREIVKKLRELKKRFKVKELGNGWYKKPTGYLEEIYSSYVE